MSTARHPAQRRAPGLVTLPFLLACLLFLSGAVQGEEQPGQASTGEESTAEAGTQGWVLTLVDDAIRLTGIRYRWGGRSPEEGFDCSGFVRYVFAKVTGQILPHSARQMSGLGERIDRKALQPGDLVFFNTLRRSFSHVGIYLGEGMFIHAPSRGGSLVRVNGIEEPYYRDRYEGARRIAP